jgi:hypothetical protein
MVVARSVQVECQSSRREIFDGIAVLHLCHQDVRIYNAPPFALTGTADSAWWVFPVTWRDTCSADALVPSGMALLAGTE